MHQCGSCRSKYDVNRRWTGSVRENSVHLCYHNLPVKIIGAGGGFVYGPQGTTHHAIEEIGILRTLPNMTVISPSDPLETGKAIHASMDLEGPAYVRIGRNNEPAAFGDCSQGV
ncbi:MAG: hypothetical protein DRI57_30470 [Deltaproteobacteria bacterium]|nr:MAG: hypothetical protein DRI57_30470 [Deltaproteobacteria bacterium]